jgi:hypothetical protein|tara:strand:- start:101 stop:790 length:690 start_codon:yes stop_codon:yes gene_type:complete
MAEETNRQEPAAFDASQEIDQLQKRLQAMDRKNAELLDEYKKAVEKSKAVPDGVDIQELLDFKAKAEQADLEKQGKYTEARQALEQQFREATEEKDKRIAELEARVRELELIAPANNALADVVHDPSIVFKAQLLNPNQIEREPDGTVVVVNGYERKPIGEWAKTLPSYMQKAPKPVGTGAPSGRSAGGDIPPGTKNPFAKESYNLTEQSRLYRTDRDMYERLKAAANR